MSFLRLLPILALAACATRSVIDTSLNHTRLGDHARAFAVLDQHYREETAAGNEIGPELEKAHHEARLEFLRDRAQARIFQEREDAALADLAELRALAPEYPALHDLTARAKHKKAIRIAMRGDESFVRKDFAQALAWYLESQQTEPDLPQATEGIENVRKATERLTVRAQEQFLEAVRKLPEFRFVEVQWHAANVLHNAPQRADAKEIKDKARRENAEKALARGKECEQQGQFGAAMLEYKLARELDPTLPGVEAAVDQMQRELEAAVLVDLAQKQMRANNFTGAREQLGKAFELSVMARNDIGELVAQAKRREGEYRYNAARDLEVLGKKAEALAAFEAVAKDWPDGLSDEKARIDSLKVDLEGAQKEWAEAEAAEAAGDAAKAIEHYEASERFYAGWKDGKDRIKRLRATLPPGSAGGENRGNG